MARIVKEYDKRRNEILQAAQRLFYTQGYDSTSVQNIIDSVGIAYHYFNSKQALLDELIARMVHDIVNSLEIMIADQQLNAVQKLNRFFSDSSAIKLEKKQVIHTLLQVFYDDENVILREKLNAESIRVIIPMLTCILQQGIEEGSFHCDSPDELAEILIHIIKGFSDKIVRSMGEIKSDDDLFQLVLHKTIAYERAIERILGASSDSLHILSPEQIDQWLKFSAIHTINQDTDGKDL